MIHKACMPVYMNSGKIVAGGRDGWTSKVLQEVLADLKMFIYSLSETTKSKSQFLRTIPSIKHRLASFYCLTSREEMIQID